MPRPSRPRTAGNSGEIRETDEAQARFAERGKAAPGAARLRKREKIVESFPLSRDSSRALSFRRATIPFSSSERVGTRAFRGAVLDGFRMAFPKQPRCRLTSALRNHIDTDRRCQVAAP